MKTKKELKGLFTSFKGLEKLKTMEKNGACNGIYCTKCPLDRRNLNTSIDCVDIIDLDGYAAGNPEEIKRMNKVIDIFTEEKINKTLSLIDNRLKYNSKVIYNGDTYKIKGVLKKRFIEEEQDAILLNSFGYTYDASYQDCIVKESDMKKEYTLWVDVKNIEI